MATHACSRPALTRCLPQVMAKTVSVRRSSQGKLSKDKIKAAFAKNKRLPTPYEERLYQVRAALHYKHGMRLAADLCTRSSAPAYLPSQAVHAACCTICYIMHSPCKLFSKPSKSQRAARVIQMELLSSSTARRCIGPCRCARPSHVGK